MSLKYYFGYICILIVGIIYGIQPFLTELFLPKNGINSILIITSEIIKIGSCMGILIIQGEWIHIWKMFDIRESLSIAMIPSIIYSMQNNLALFAYLNLDPLTFNLVNQSKIIFNAIFLYIIMGKTQTIRQIISIIMLFFVALILSYETTQMKNNNILSGNRDENKGLICVIIVSMLSGIGGTLIQKALQSQKRNSLLLTIELGFYGTIFNILSLFIQYYLNIPNMEKYNDGVKIMKYGIFYRMNFKVLIPIISNAFAGIFIGLIIKYTSVIHKSYTVILSILFCGLFRYIIYSLPLTYGMHIGIPLVILSLYLYANPYSKKKSE